MFTFSLIENENKSCRISCLSFDSDIIILADPSWDGNNHEDINFVEKYLKNVNIILLSHSTPEFISGFILLCIKFPQYFENIKIYSTVPVNQLGRISTVEYYRLNGILGPLKDSILEVIEIDEWFDKIIQLKYFQTISLFDNKLIITPYNAGHTLGGTFWLINKKIEKIIYAPSWNHSKDSFLNSASFLGGIGGTPLQQLIRPTVLITNTDLGSSMSHKRRTEKFLQLVDATLANGGSVLLPISLLGRFLEILHLIDQHLQSAPIPVLFLSYSGTKALSYASNLLEWMSSQLIKEWEDSQNNNSVGLNKNNTPFDPSKVDLIADPKELIQLTGPKIVFCTGIDFKNGDMSTEALKILCNDERTTIILTEKSKFQTNSNNLTNQLYQDWFNLSKSRNNNIVEDGIPVPFEKILNFNNSFIEENLVGDELKDFEKKISEKRKINLLAKVQNKRNKNLLNTDNFDDSSSDDEDDEEEDEDVEDVDNAEQNKKIDIDEERLESVAAAAAVAAATSIAVDDNETIDSLLTDQIKQTLANKKPLDIRVTHKLKPRQAMFPFFPVTHKQKFDDYGEIIDIKNFQKVDDLSQKKFYIDKRKFNNNSNNHSNNHNDFDNNKNVEKVAKITPQEILNNEVLKKNLDTLFAPKKRILTLNSIKKLKVRCGLSFVDLSGLVDLRSLSLIVSLIKPYNLLLLPDETSSKNSETNQSEVVLKMFEQQQSSKEEQKLIKNNLLSTNHYMSLSNIRSNLYGGSSSSLNQKMTINYVEANKVIKIGFEDDGIGLTNFELKLDESIFENLNWQNIDGSYKVAQIYGELEISNANSSSDGGDKKRLKTINDYMNNSTQFTLKNLLKKDYISHQQKFIESLNSSNIDKFSKIVQDASSTSKGPKLAIGNVRLTELKKQLIAKNLNAEFKSEGTLVVNDKLAIRKITYGSGEGEDDTGDIIIDGQIGPLYYEVKDCIRDMLAYV